MIPVLPYLPKDEVDNLSLLPCCHLSIWVPICFELVWWILFFLFQIVLTNYHRCFQQSSISLILNAFLFYILLSMFYFFVVGVWLISSAFVQHFQNIGS